MKIQGIVADKIYDSIHTSIAQETLKNEEFIINSNESYIKGEKIYIDKISVDYNFIGIMDDEDILSLPDSNDNKNFGIINIKAFDKDIKLNGIKNSSYESQYIQTSYVLDDDKIEKTPNSVRLYKEFEGNISFKNNKKINVFKYGLRFFVDNLKVKISGKIGENKFNAIKDYRKYNEDLKCNYVNINPVELTREDTLGLSNYKNYKNSYNYKTLKIANPEVGLNFTPINICEKMNLNDKIKIKLNLEGYLSAKDIILVEKYQGNNKIRALINYSFLIESHIYFINKENIAVFVKDKELL